MRYLLGCVAACFILAGCSSTRLDSDTEARAARHMAIADSLEEARALDQAVLEYKIVAELYPSSSAYASAVRKAALLYLNPDNPARNDSLALHWVSVYLGLPVPWAERESARAQLTLLERVMALQSELQRRGRVIDSLAAVARKQDAQISDQAAQLQQIQTLQNELKQARQELDRLKQVDVDISRSRRK
jgi:hypothetical protein